MSIKTEDDRLKPITIIAYHKHVMHSYSTLTATNTIPLDIVSTTDFTRSPRLGNDNIKYGSQP